VSPGDESLRELLWGAEKNVSRLWKKLYGPSTAIRTLELSQIFITLITCITDLVRDCGRTFLHGVTALATRWLTGIEIFLVA
jgi:hypothetical protein